MAVLDAKISTKLVRAEFLLLQRASVNRTNYPVALQGSRLPIYL